MVPSGMRCLRRWYSRWVWLVMMKPKGTGMPSEVISQRLAPLLPSKSLRLRLPSEKSQTGFRIHAPECPEKGFIKGGYESSPLGSCYPKSMVTLFVNLLEALYFKELTGVVGIAPDQANRCGPTERTPAQAGFSKGMIIFIKPQFRD